MLIKTPSLFQLKPTMADMLVFENHASSCLNNYTKLKADLHCDSACWRLFLAWRCILCIVDSPFLGRALLLSCLVDCGALCNAIIMALPKNDRVGWKAEDALDGLANHFVSLSLESMFSGLHRILILRPPSFFVQTLRTSSPLLTLTTMPQTSSPASAN